MKTDVRKAIGNAAMLLTLCVMQMMGTKNAKAATWYVATTGNDSNSGTTAAKPFKSIQQGVNYASPGDTVSVADGTYTGAKNYNIDFGGVDLTVKSASGNPANCIIDCHQQDRAFYLRNNETTKSSIAGFTIKNGMASQYGGGVYVSSNSPIVKNCIFTANTAGYGGGGMYGGTATDCTFAENSANLEGGAGMDGGTATNCTFISNTATFGCGGMENGTATGCVFVANSCPYGSGGMSGGTATNCAFINNSASEGGGLYDGAAVNCVFSGNIASDYGGGMYLGEATNCVFTGNTAGRGGGMSHSTATNCVFFENMVTQYTYAGVTTPGDGGGAYDSSLYFCTIVNNLAQGNGGGVYFDSNSNYTMTNCIVWGNTAIASGLNIYGSGTVTYSDIQRGSTGTNGNIASDPKFVNQVSGNLHLTAASTACVNVGTTIVPVDQNGNHFTFPTTDLDGAKRPDKTGTKPDMGAYEYGNVGVYGTLAFAGIAAIAPAQIITFQFRPITGGAAIAKTYFTTSDGAFYLYGIPNGKYNLWVKSPTYLSVLVPVTVTSGKASITATLEPGDANNDNSVDTTDFGILIGAYGGDASIPGSGYDATADFNSDGSVDTTDFGILVGSYGDQGAP